MRRRGVSQNGRRQATILALGGDHTLQQATHTHPFLQPEGTIGWLHIQGDFLTGPPP